MDAEQEEPTKAPPTEPPPATESPPTEPPPTEPPPTEPPPTDPPPPTQTLAPQSGDVVFYSDFDDINDWSFFSLHETTPENYEVENYDGYLYLQADEEYMGVYGVYDGLFFDRDNAIMLILMSKFL
jgi:hypothetical protein